MTDTKPDLSRETVAQMVRDLRNCASKFPCDAADMIEALLDAKEAAERTVKALQHNIKIGEAQITEARASAAAAWEAGKGHTIATICKAGVDASGFSVLANPDPSATEALRRVKEAVWEEGFEAGVDEDTYTNPYAAKETAND